MLEKQLLFLKIVAYAASMLFSALHRGVSVKFRQCLRLVEKRPSAQRSDTRNIVVIGASFAGYQVVHQLATSFPPNGRYQVVVIEPNSHFNFTWVLPRFCVVSGHEHKAFIPYGPHIPATGSESVRWIRDRVLTVERTCVRLRDSGEEVPYEFLVVATGSGEGERLPSRVGSEEKGDGIQLLKDVQSRIRDAKKIVVVGGGAAGVELAADAKEAYPEKSVVLVHSRKAVMHRFGAELQQAALDGLVRLGVENILEERLVAEDSEQKTVTLSSGKKVECDYLIRCTGQKPASQCIADLSPESISESQHIRVKETLQIADATLPSIYACGDVAHIGVRNPNSRSAFHQATVVADNIALAMNGKQPSRTYKPRWEDEVIKLTLGLTKSITHFGDDATELLFHSKEPDLALMSRRVWQIYDAKPFEDDSGHSISHGAEASPTKSGS